MTGDIISSDRTFTVKECEVIATIAAATIEADPSRNLPSAADPLILPAILHRAEHFAPRIKTGIQALLAESDIDDTNVLDTLDQDPRHRSLSRIMTIVIMQSYYQNSGVLDALGLASRPPFPDGHILDAGDWDLLDPVKSRGSLYRKAP